MMEWLRLPEARYRSAEYRDARPFPHVVIDGALDARDARAVADEFPPPDDPRWHTFTGPLEEGKQEGQATIAGPCVAAVHSELASEEFVRWLREVSGVPDLQADPHQVGGGIHQSAEGARLGMHVDFRLNPRDEGLVRAVNLLLFVGAPGDDWQAGGDDGALRLRLDPPVPHEGDMFVYPNGGVMVAFQASDQNYHGHPDPIMPGRPLRRSIPAYFYRPVRDGEHVEQHSTLFLDTR